MPEGVFEPSEPEAAEPQSATEPAPFEEAQAGDRAEEAPEAEGEEVVASRPDVRVTLAESFVREVMEADEGLEHPITAEVAVPGHEGVDLTEGEQEVVKADQADLLKGVPAVEVVGPVDEDDS